MNRQQMMTFAIEILEQVRWDIIGYYFSAYEVNQCIKLVSAYRHGKRADMKMEAIVNDGFLFINGDAVGRVAPKLPKVACTEYGKYLENKILIRQEKLWED